MASTCRESESESESGPDSRRMRWRWALAGADVAGNGERHVPLVRAELGDGTGQGGVLAARRARFARGAEPSQRRRQRNRLLRLRRSTGGGQAAGTGLQR